MLDNVLELLLGGEVTVIGALFMVGVDGGSAGDDTSSTAAVMLTVSSELENPAVAPLF